MRDNGKLKIKPFDSSDGKFGHFLLSSFINFERINFLGCTDLVLLFVYLKPI